jgi:hypothetical protein
METDVTPDAWLSQFQAEVQPLIVAWFAYGASQRPQTPDGLLKVVERVCRRKMEWSIEPRTRELCSALLLALCHQRAGAWAYAATLLAPQEGL